MIRCQKSGARGRHLVRRYRRGLWEKRKAWLNSWEMKFRRLAAYDQAWARSTGACESGNNPATNTGNGFFGAFQFMLSTWHMAGGGGYPHHASWHEQAVRAVRWRNKTSDEQWPVCGD